MKFRTEMQRWANVACTALVTLARGLPSDALAILGPQVCVFTDRFFGKRIFVEGSAEVLSLPEAMDSLID
ncbi:MAG: hypothetical protein WBV53_12125 [Solirubrobacterales bacterium]